MRTFFSLIFSLFIFVSVKAEDEGSDGSCGAGEGASDQENFTEGDSEQEEEEESHEATDALSSLIFIFSQIFLFSLTHLVWCLVSLSPFPFLNPYFPPPIFPLLASFPLSRHSLSPVSLYP
jgi:heme/copper-type cytochrome/quinol oxidase subunit 3